MKLKHALSVALATLSVGAGVILAQPNVALAHHANVSGTTSCRATAQSDWTVVWTLNPSENRDYYSITQSGWSPAGNTTWQPRSAGNFPNSTRSVTYLASQATGTSPATEVQWRFDTNGSIHKGQADIGSVSRPNVCPSQTTTPPTISGNYDCVSDGPATFTLNPASGNWTATGDQDPSKFGVQVTVTANAGYTFSGANPRVLVLTVVEDNNCEVTAVTPTVSSTAECQKLDTYTIPNTAGVVYSQAPGTYNLDAGQTVTITATAAAGKRLTNPAFSASFTGSPVENCPITPPNIAGTYNCVNDRPATFTLTPLTGNWTASGDQDPSKFGIQVTITANPGYTFPDGTTKVLTLTVGRDNRCEVTAVAPSVDETAVCQTLDSYTIPNTPGVVYSQAPGTYELAPGQTVTITAVAAAGSRLTNPEFSVTLTGGVVENCVIDPPELNGNYDCVNDGPATFTLTPTSGNWSASGDEDPSKLGIQVTITANPGSTFADGTTKVLTLTVDEDDSCEVTAVDPLVDHTAECLKLDTYTIPNTPGVVYSQAPGIYELNTGETVTITATAAGGSRLSNPEFAFTITGGAIEDCSIEPPVLTAGYDCVSEQPWATLSPADGEHWTAGPITKVADKDQFTVTVTPDPGYLFADSAEGQIVLTATFGVDDECVIDPPVLTAGYDCVSQTSSYALTPPSSEEWTAGEVDLEGTTYSVTITANEGSRFTDGPSVTLTAGFEVTSGCEQTVAEPTLTPPTCSAPGSVDTTETPYYTWTTNEDGTYTAVAKQGVRLVGQTTYGPYDTAQLPADQCVEPSIGLTAFSPVCQSDIPYIQYEIQVSGTDATTAKITLIDNTGTVVAVHENMGLTGRFLYPGASDDPQDWPGWKQVGGKWVLDDKDHHWRQGLKVRVEVNPTAETSVVYPAETPACFDPPVVDQEGPTTTTTTTVPGQAPPIAPTPSLPRTGSNSTGMAVTIGAMLLLGGLALLTVVRRPRRA